MLIDAVNEYIKLGRAAGFAYWMAEASLRTFALTATAAGDTHVRSLTAISWAAQAQSPQQRQRRLRLVRDFAKHVHAEDPSHEIPSADVFPSASRVRPLPNIYTPDQIARILAEAGRLGPVGSLRPATFQTMFGLIAACGLRASEALGLQIDDVTRDGLVIRETKFRKSRLVPIHESTRRALDAYLTRRCSIPTDSRSVFISMRGQAIAYPTANTTFVLVACKAGIRTDWFPGAVRRGRVSSELRPRMHDLRHTFAVRALESCPRDNVVVHLHALSTYLGHARPADTYWYLHATPQLMSSISDACRESLEVTP